MSDDLVGEVAHGVAGYRKADAGCGASAELGVGRGEGGDADDLAGEGDERPAAIARVDGSAGLDDVRQRRSVRLTDRAVERADDPVGDTALKAKWIPHR